MSLHDQIEISSVWTNVDVRGSNLTGTPVNSAALEGSGEEISDTYTLTISARSGSGGTVTITASANNPFNGKVVTGVVFDNTTVNGDIIPGVNLKFNSSGANGNTAQVIIGSPFGPFDASGIGAGVPTTGVRHRVLNDGSADVSDAHVSLINQAIQVHMINNPLSYVGPFAPGSTEKVAGGGSFRVMPYALTISSIAGSGSSKTCTLNIDGSPFGTNSILDMTTGTQSDGTGLKAITPGYHYQVITGPLTGLEFAIDPGVANADKANVLIFPSRYVQIAPDVSGVEGTYSTTDVDLTEAGQSTGVITNTTGVAYFWVRFLVPSGANNESNPYPCNFAIVASESTSAGWGA